MGTKQMSRRILIVDDEKEIADLLEDFLMVEGFHVSKAFNAKEARKHLEKKKSFLFCWIS
ncbi:response regulator [Rossellomorea sp. H39__3]